jgi:hypothetical protein
VDYATLQNKLSPFQLEKLTYLFRCLFDCNQDGVIDVSPQENNLELVVVQYFIEVPGSYKTRNYP